MKAEGTGVIRASISFPLDLSETLEEIAKEKKVSLAWVVRDVAQKHVSSRTIDGAEPTGKS